MAPEVYGKREYIWAQHDLYGAAIVLFVLATQHPPFLKADPRDKYFKRVYDKNWVAFWDIHSEIDLSQNFKSLLSKMLAFDPEERLTLAQIKESSWYNGKVPTPEEIFEIFSKKSSQRKMSLHPIKSCQTKPFHPHKIRSKFFEVNNGDDLLNLVIQCARKNDIPCYKSREFYRIQIIAEEFGEETEIIVSILKKPDSNKRAIEFEMEKGSNLTFKSTVRKLKEYVCFYF